MATPTSTDKTQTQAQPVNETPKSVNAQRRPRSISNLNDVAALVLTQINAVSGKKDELTIAIKGLTDTCQQLVRAYAQNSKTIAELQRKVRALEGKNAE